MLTTKDIKIKETKLEELTILSTSRISEKGKKKKRHIGNIEPKQFEPKGKPSPPDKTIITTGNVEKFQKKKKKK